MKVFDRGLLLYLGTDDMSAISATAMRVRPGRWRVRLGPPGRHCAERFVFRRRSARRLLEKFATRGADVR